MSSSASSTAPQPSPHAPTTTPPSTQPTATPPRPSSPTARHTTEARTALVASLSNLLDSELTPRATALHSASASLAKQERDVARATGALAAETGRLAKEAEVAGRGVKMLGNVQNWAEVLEREFLVLEETVKIVGEGECGSECCSCEEGSDEGSGDEGGEGKRVDLEDMASKLGALDFGTGDTTLNGSLNESTAGSGNEHGEGDGKKDKGKEPVYPAQTHPGSQASFFESSRGPETDSPGGTDVRGSETASLT